MCDRSKGSRMVDHQSKRLGRGNNGLWDRSERGWCGDEGVRDGSGNLGGSGARLRFMEYFIVAKGSAWGGELDERVRVSNKNCGAR